MNIFIWIFSKFYRKQRWKGSMVTAFSNPSFHFQKREEKAPIISFIDWLLLFYLEHHTLEEFLHVFFILQYSGVNLHSI